MNMKSTMRPCRHKCEFFATVSDLKGSNHAGVDAITSTIDLYEVKPVFRRSEYPCHRAYIQSTVNPVWLGQGGMWENDVWVGFFKIATMGKVWEEVISKMRVVSTSWSLRKASWKLFQENADELCWLPCVFHSSVMSKQN